MRSRSGMVLCHVRNLRKRHRHFAGVILPQENQLVGLLVYGLDEKESFGGAMLPMEFSGTFPMETVEGLEGNFFHGVVSLSALSSAKRFVGCALIKSTAIWGMLPLTG